MKFLLDFLHQKTPQQGAEMPAYFRNALTIGYKLLVVYFPLCFLLFAWLAHRWEPAPAALFAVAAMCLPNVRRMSARVNLLLYMAIILFWSAWFVRTYGWTCSAQHLLMPLLLLVFFDIHEPPRLKILLFLFLVAFRMLLFSWALDHDPVCALDRTGSILMQIVNSGATFITMACACILFSTNTQATERQLRIVNQTLHREADTDPLTQLPNRRAMLEEINQFLEKTPNEPFCVAIADIDFFKQVNDTYGHACGDYALKSLADLFRTTAGVDYHVCRWGGEEFFFFMPGKNLDEAAQEMFDLNGAVRRMPLSYEGKDFNMTITIGVAENDFRSPMQAILDEADQKLYLGKASGRNQVVA